MLQRQLFNMYQRRKRRVAVPTMVADVYVDINATGANDGSSWKNAYTSLQVAITESTVDDLIAVNDGVYAPIVTSNKRITIESVNGAAVTIIDGGGTSMCATLGTLIGHTSTVINGFTLTNGFTTGNGGGSYGGTLNNCTLTGNTADGWGGGSYGGTLNNCTLSGNTAVTGGGTSNGTLNNCILTGNTANNGGGSYVCTLNNCTLSGNTANKDGGGSYGGTLTGCTISGNTANATGGGSYGGTLTGCTISGNTAPRGGGTRFSVVYNSAIYNNTATTAEGALSQGKYYNCTIHGNTAPSYAVGAEFGHASEPAIYNCVIYGNINTGPSAVHLIVPPGGIFYCSSIDSVDKLRDGVNTPTVFPVYGDPQFTDPANNDFRLQQSSPCIDAGSNDYVTTATDLDGNQRIVNGTVDMGAYEFQGE